MVKYSIDTSVWIAYFSGKTTVSEIIEKGDLVTSILAIAELSDKFARNDIDIIPALLYIQSRAEIIQLTSGAVLEAAAIKSQRKKCSKFGLVDAIQLASAREEGAVMVTKDKDFTGFSDVVIV